MPLAKSDRNYLTKANIIWGSVLLAQMVFFVVLPELPKVWKYFFSFFEWQKDAHIALFAGIPMALGDGIYMLLVLIILCFVLMVVLRKRNKNARVLWGIGIGFHLFYQLFWGIVYHTPPVDSMPEPTVYEAVKVARKLIYQANRIREKLPKDLETTGRIHDFSQAVLGAQASIPRSFQKYSPIASKSVKPSLFSPVLSYVGVLGYYNPFTAEANINTHQPATMLPFTISHEMAHQMGHARESDANFIGYLLSIHSKDATLEYSALSFAIRYLLRYIAQENEKTAKYLENTLSEIIREDMRKEKAFFQRYSGWTNDMFSALNDWFLKSNQQDGIITYSYATALIIRYEMGREIRINYRP